MNGVVKTFVFLDLEATGLNKDRPKITEICLIAVHVSSLENPVTNEAGEVQLPRVMDKLCLCVDPGKPLTEGASSITGLSNKNLGNSEKQKFDTTLINAINEFVNRQAKPVCLVAHNGFFYDFPLLKTELLEQNEDFPGTMLCLDSLQAFRDLDSPTSRYIKGRHTLTEIYRQNFGKEPNHSHFAEGDVLTLILVFICQAREILKVPSYKNWEEIRPMYT
ncbi:three prime repair exonuclease 2 [Hyla sarda]|uniref:three prime repair exonuclease 2 n=1 Tax=Hyla sarda TaxID=327740 RepID=UPI0024C23F96|nr:three prime repair exonuclease 2 [Hyla sarda]XP_056396745.1 three prime repair exonuclease 2 [Hyla sarda]